MSTIAAALHAARQAIPVAEARLLLCHELGRSPAWLEAHRDEAVDSQSAGRYAALVARRAEGEPIAYLTGLKEFYGRPFAVSPAVLIPRPETELLVETVVAQAAELAAPHILDLGTGSGCIAVTLALELPRAVVTALDASADALAMAAANAEALGARIGVLASDWYAALGEDRFDIIVSNPPYIAARDPHLSQGDLRFEPSAALASGDDGLDAIRHIVAQASCHLNASGCLWLEHSYDQAAAVAELLAAAGFRRVEQYRDLAGIVRVSGGYRGP